MAKLLYLGLERSAVKVARYVLRELTLSNGGGLLGYYALSWVLARTFGSDINQISEEVDRSKKQLLELCQDIKHGGDALNDQDQARIYANKIMQLINAKVNKANNTTYAQN